MKSYRLKPAYSHVIPYGHLGHPAHIYDDYKHVFRHKFNHQKGKLDRVGEKILVIC